MTPSANKEGPTVLWGMLKGKNVKTNDGKELGEINEITDNFLRLQKGTVSKKKFWIPKYTADAYDGKVLWLLTDEEGTSGQVPLWCGATRRTVCERLGIIQRHTFWTEGY
jgi:hypothetical protein